MLSLNKKGQVPGFVVVIVLLIMLFLGIVVFALLSTPLKTFIDVGVNSSEEAGDPATGFFIKLIPVWIILLFLGYAVYVIATGGGIFS